jgi:hypothetical protein
VNELSEMESTVKASNLFGSEGDLTSSDSVQAVIAALTDVLAGVPFGAALANQDAADFGELAAENLDT